MTALDPALEAQIEDGRISILPLVKFELPNNPVGYHFGGREFTWNGFLYKPNRYLDPGSFKNALGTEVSKRTITFSGVPTDDPADAIAKLEDLEYTSAKVILSFLGGDPDTDEFLGLLDTQVYEIDSVRHPKPPAGKDGLRKLTIEIDLEPPGRVFRDQTYAKRSNDEQRFDNDPADTAFEDAATVKTIPEEWGQRSG